MPLFVPFKAGFENLDFASFSVLTSNIPSDVTIGNWTSPGLGDCSLTDSNNVANFSTTPNFSTIKIVDVSLYSWIFMLCRAGFYNAADGTDNGTGYRAISISQQGALCRLPAISTTNVGSFTGFNGTVLFATDFFNNFSNHASGIKTITPSFQHTAGVNRNVLVAVMVYAYKFANES